MNRRRLCIALLTFACLAHACQSPPRATAPSPTTQRKEPTVWVNEPPPGSLPTGMTHHTYFSKSMRETIGYCIYLPPDYASSPHKRYPVIYDLHGKGGNELHGQLDARVLQEGILAGKWPPMILVMPNGGRSTCYQDGREANIPAETMFLRELIPHIDATYRTIARREGRCISGFSMGGRGATRLAVKHPDLFCSLFNEAGNVVRADEMTPPADDAFALLTKNLDQIKGKLRIQIFCGTQDKNHLNSIREFHQSLLAAGVDHTYLEIEGLAHDQAKMTELYRPIWFDYHVESLRRSGALPSTAPADQRSSKL